MSIVLIALIGAYLGQTALNTHARNLTLAMNDATRVMEEIRQQNVGAACTARGYPAAIPVYLPADATPTWNEWLEAAAANQGGGGKSIGPTPTFEQVAVTCQDGSGATANYCGPQQMAGGYRQAAANLPRYDPIRITVAIGWREKDRVIGNNGSGQAEFQFGWHRETMPAATMRAVVQRLGNALVPSAHAAGGGGGGGPPPAPSQWAMADSVGGNGVIDSQAMLTTLITCR